MRRLGLLALLAVGCAASPTPSATSAALESTDVSVTCVPASEGPPGSDAEPTCLATLHGADGRARALPDPVLGAVSFNAGAAVLRRDHTLVYEHLDGRTIEMAQDVPAPPVASVDGAHLAYAAPDGDGLEVRVHDGSRATVAARGLVSAGAFAFSDDARLVAFVGARNGGIAGAWVARSDGGVLAAGTLARCASACDVRVGDTLPAPPAAFERISAERLVFRDTTGARTELSWRAP